MLVLFTAGCVSPAALTRGARGIGGRVTPVAQSFANGTRRVVRLAGQAAEDTALAARVKAALGMHKGLEGCALHIGSEEGVIRLTGTAPSPGKKRLAGEVARGTVGVAGVRNCLRVIGSP